MLIRTCTTAIVVALLAVPANAQFIWPAKGKKAAIVLTYDDALRSQLDIAIPQLNTAGFHGTFFSAQAHQELLDWLQKHPDVWVATFQEVMDYVGTRTR
jgi:hypothetical protein